MNKSIFAKLGVLTASNLIAASAFAGILEVKVAPAEPKINVEPKIATPAVTPIGAKVGATFNVNGLNAAFAVKPTAKPANENKAMEMAGSCNANFPQTLAKLGGTSVEMVNSLFAEGLLSADEKCSTGFQEAGAEPQANAVKAALYAHNNGYFTAAADQKPGILGHGLQAAMNNTISLEEATSRIMHVSETCGWVAPQRDKDYSVPAVANDNVKFGNVDSIN